MMTTWAQRKLDAYEQELVNEIQLQYDDSSEDIDEIISAYLSQYEEEDNKMRNAVIAGTIAVVAYKRWRRKTLLSGDSYEKFRDDYAKQLVNLDVKVVNHINGAEATEYASAKNFTSFVIDASTAQNTSFELYDKTTVKRLLKKNPKTLPTRSVNKKMNTRIYRRRLNTELASAIVRGESIPDLSKTLQHVFNMSSTAATRSARTAMTSAQNGGRQEAYNEAIRQGVNLKKQWVASLDSRTRSSHAHIDGEIVAANKKFSNGLRYPGDARGLPEEVYNCRCRMVTIDPLTTNSERRSIDGVGSYATYKQWEATR